MRHRLAYSALLASALALSACATVEAPTETPPIEEIDAQIARAVETTSAVDQEVSEVEIASHVSVPMREDNGADVPPGVVLPPDAIQPVTVNFTGPIEDFLADMAGRAGYVFGTSGMAPANPIVISITATEEPLFGVIRRAGNMANGAADIVFNPTSKSIGIRYDD